MSKKLSILFALVLMLGIVGIATAENPAPAADLDLAAVLALDQKSCDTPAVSAEPATDLSLEDELRLEAAGEPCNQTTCNAKQFCCNFSCSICAPRGGGCIQIVCD